MATTPQIPVEEYLRMQFDGTEMEYVDGELVERRLGGKPHSKSQKNLVLIFADLEKRGHSASLRSSISGWRLNVFVWPIYPIQAAADHDRDRFSR